MAWKIVQNTLQTISETLTYYSLHILFSQHASFTQNGEYRRSDSNERVEQTEESSKPERQPTHEETTEATTNKDVDDLPPLVS